MPRIIPIRDLRDTGKMSEMCNESREPIFITKSIKSIMSDFKEAKPSYLFLVPMVVESMYRKIWMNAEEQGKTGLLKTMIKISGFNPLTTTFSDMPEKATTNPSKAPTIKNPKKSGTRKSNTT